MKHKIVFLLILFMIACLQADFTRSYFSGELDGQKIWLKITKDSDSLKAELTLDNTLNALRLYGTFKDSDNSIILQSDEFPLQLVGQYNDRKHLINGSLQLNSKEHDLLLQEEASDLCFEKTFNRIHSKIEYPVFLKQNEFHRKINEIQEKVLTKRSITFFAEGRQSWLDSPEYIIGYDLYSTNEIELYSMSLVSILQIDYAYTGGAHGNTKLAGINYLFEQNEMKQVLLSDFFQSQLDYEKILLKICYEDLKKQGASSIINGTMSELSNEYLKLFTFNSAHLIIHYQQYEVGCYAEGSYQVKIPWKELSDILTNNEVFTKF